MLKSLLKQRQERKALKMAEEKKLDDIDLLNHRYGGDWYWCDKRQMYADAATTRVATVGDA